MSTKAYAAHSAKSPLAAHAIKRREPLATDVQIDILYCGVCHSDLHQARDEWHEAMPTVYPCVPGHEIVGKVSKVGKDVKKFKVGDLVKGTVAKIASFGAFIQLQDDIDGLVHISQLSEEHVAKVKDILKVGDQVEARVIKVDRVERRIGLSIKAAEYSEEQLKKETAAFEALRPGSDLVGLEHAFNLAEEWSPSGDTKKGK